MQLRTTYFPSGEFWCWTVEYRTVVHTDPTEYKDAFTCFRAGAQFILDNL